VSGTEPPSSMGGGVQSKGAALCDGRSASLRVLRFSIFMQYGGLKAMTTPLCHWLYTGERMNMMANGSATGMASRESRTPSQTGTPRVRLSPTTVITTAHRLNTRWL
jgi:hypothetical protein